MKRQITLDYSLPTGRLTPYFDALAEGRAQALRCDRCGDVAFPPALTCARCGNASATWVALSGRAELMHRTDTPDAAYALARFDGAQGAAMVRISTPELITSRGRLIPPPEHHAGLWLELDLEEAENDD